MKRFAILFLLLSFTLAPQAQKKHRASKAKVTKTTGKARQSNRKRQAARSSQPTVQSLQSERKQIQQQIRSQEQRLRSNRQDVRKRLQNLMIINTEIEGTRRTIEGIRNDITGIDRQIDLCCDQLDDLQRELQRCRERYVKSMRYMHRHRSAPSQLMFIFSADNLSQMYRRLRFVREYAAYQRVQGDQVRAQQEAVDRKIQEISRARSKKTDLLAQGEREQQSLVGQQSEQQKVVKTLQREQKTIEGIIAQQRKRDTELNARIDRMIAEEVARQKSREAAEASRRAEAEAAKRHAEELARKKAEAERIARDNERRIAEAKEREETARREAREARDRREREAAERRARRAEERRLAAERKAAEEARRHEREVAEASKKAEEALVAPSEDRRISGSFESNRGRLPMPITGSYRVVSHFGQYNVEGLRNVTLDNKGINIRGEAGAQARSIFEGEVSAVFSFGGSMVVMVRHGSFISVYCNLASVSVHRGQKVSTRQPLGRIASDNILQFQLRRETAKLNPEAWLSK